MYGGARYLLDESVLALALLPVLLLVGWRMRRRGASWARVGLVALFIAWAMLLAVLVFFPLPLPPYERVELGVGGGIHGWPSPWASVIPFATIAESVGLGFEWPAARYLLGNLLAFAPLGFLAPLLWPRWQGWGRVLLLGLLVSGCIELTQLALSLLMGFPFRVADVDDLLLNTTGTLLGYGALVVARRVLGVVNHRGGSDAVVEEAG